jgi:hypothetical protein
MRPIKQRDSYSCGPVAISNVILANGWKLSPLKVIANKVNCRKDVGTWNGDLVQYFRNKKRITLIRYNLPLKKIKQLSKKYSIILILDYAGEDGHYAAVHRFTPQGAWLANHCAGIPEVHRLKPLCWVSEQTLKNKII